MKTKSANLTSYGMMGYMRAHTVTSRYVHKAEPIHKDVQCSAAKLYKMMLKMNNVIIHPKEMGI